MVSTNTEVEVARLVSRLRAELGFCDPHRTRLASPDTMDTLPEGEFNREGSQGWASRQGWERGVCVWDPSHSVSSPGVGESF